MIFSSLQVFFSPKLWNLLVVRSTFQWLLRYLQLPNEDFFYGTDALLWMKLLRLNLKLKPGQRAKIPWDTMFVLYSVITATAKKKWCWFVQDNHILLLPSESTIIILAYLSFLSTRNFELNDVNSYLLPTLFSSDLRTDQWSFDNLLMTLIIYL